MTAHETVKAALVAALLFSLALAIGISSPRPRDEHVPRLTRTYCPAPGFDVYVPCAFVDPGEIDL